MKLISLRDKQRGQVGLVVLLVMAVLLTVGIGVATESVVNQKTARQEEDSSETFNVAESGVEEALSQDLSGIGANESQSIDVNIDGWQGGVNVQVTGKNIFTKMIVPGDSSEINLAGTTNMMTVSWGAGENCGSTASLVVTLFRKSDYSIQRFAYGPDCRSSDGFAQVGQSDGSYSVNLDTGGYDFARIKAVYAQTQVTVSGNLPVQQYEIVSQANRDSGEARAVAVDKGLPVVPSIFDFALFAGVGNIAVSQ